MGYVLPECLGDSVPPYWHSSSASPTEIAPIEEGDSRGSVDENAKEQASWN